MIKIDEKHTSLDYMKFIYNIITTFKMNDKSIKHFRINVQLGEDVDMRVSYVYGDYMLFDVIDIIIDKDINKLVENIEKSSPDFIKFISSLIKEPTVFDLLIITILHEIGHLKLSLKLSNNDK